MRRVEVLALVPPHPHREAIELDGWRELPETEQRSEALRDALAEREHEIGLAHHVRRHEEMRHLHCDASLLAEARERRVDDAPRATSRRDEHVRKRHEVVERE